MSTHAMLRAVPRAAALAVFVGAMAKGADDFADAIVDQKVSLSRYPLSASVVCGKVRTLSRFSASFFPRRSVDCSDLAHVAVPAAGVLCHGGPPWNTIGTPHRRASPPYRRRGLQAELAAGVGVDSPTAVAASHRTMGKANSRSRVASRCWVLGRVGFRAYVIIETSQRVAKVLLPQRMGNACPIVLSNGSCTIDVYVSLLLSLFFFLFPLCRIASLRTASCQ